MCVTTSAGCSLNSAGTRTPSGRETWPLSDPTGGDVGVQHRTPHRGQESMILGGGAQGFSYGHGHGLSSVNYFGLLATIILAGSGATWTGVESMVMA